MDMPTFMSTTLPLFHFASMEIWVETKDSGLTKVTGTLKFEKEWKTFFFEGSDAHRKLTAIVQAPMLLKDVAQLSTREQTYSCEAFHSLINQFEPKTYHYSYGRMKTRLVPAELLLCKWPSALISPFWQYALPLYISCRTLIAALHYNENHGRQQAVTASGEASWAVHFRKTRHGEASISALKEPSTYGGDICSEIVMKWANFVDSWCPIFLLLQFPEHSWLANCEI